MARPGRAGRGAGSRRRGAASAGRALARVWRGAIEESVVVVLLQKEEGGEEEYEFRSSGCIE